MATEVIIPKLGLTMTEAKIVEWLKADGEQVQEGEPHVVVMTAKVTCEIEAPTSGVLHTLARPNEGTFFKPPSLRRGHQEAIPLVIARSPNGVGTTKQSGSWVVPTRIATALLRRASQ